MINELEIKELLQLSKNKPHKSLLILIAGGAASRKSTLVDEIKNFFKQNCKEEIVTLSTDYYFLKRRSNHNREPTFFRNLSSNLKELVNWEELSNDLESLLLGDSIYLPTYDPNNDLQFTRTDVLVCSSPIVIVEGVFALLEEKIRKKSDLKIYIEVDDDLRLVRRLKRYIAELKEGKVNLPVKYELERYELYVKKITRLTQSQQKNMLI